MNKMRSFANKPRLDKHENPKRAREKKKIPRRFWKPAISFLKGKPDIRNTVQCTGTEYVRDVVHKESANHLKNSQRRTRPFDKPLAHQLRESQRCNAPSVGPGHGTGS